MNLMHTVAELLNGMRETIRIRGWTRGTLENDQGQVCMYGSMMFAEGMFGWDNDELEDMVRQSPEMTEATWLLAGLIDPEQKKLYEHYGDNVSPPTELLIHWNDYDDRTQQEVEDLIAKAEKIALNDGVDPDA